VRQALHLRVAAIGVSVIALTLAMAALITHELIQVGDRQELDRVLRQELDEIRLGLPEELAAAAGDDGTATDAEIDLAVQRYLAVHPGSARHLTVIQIGSRRLSTRDGPPALEQLQLNDDLPTGEPGFLVTVDSDAGPLRVLNAPLASGQQNLGSATIIGPLAEGRQRANDALVRIAVAGLFGLAVGGLLLLLAVRRALRPVRALAIAARAVDLADLRSRVPEPSRMDEVGLMAHEFNRMLERISRDEEQRQRLLSAVSHELRTPLAVARGHLELFETLGPRTDASAADTGAVLRRELDRLGHIVDDLTAVSRGDLSGATARGPVFAPDVLTALRHRLEGLGLDDVQITEAPPVVLLGDEDRITQALLNLVVNARTHTPPGTPVSVGVHTHNGRVVFEVLDKGPGIDRDVLPSVFEPFVTTRPVGEARASGLGLTVVKAVTEAQGGQVNLDTGAKGTAVSMSFPIDTAT
jgi:signal transduction histidine kinase